MITVIIVNYFSAKLTARAVDSVLCEPEEAEVIVVDNSVDAEEVDALQHCLPRTRVRLHVNRHNIGFAQACNQAYRLSSGEHVLLLNPDAYLLPGALGTLDGVLRVNSRIAAVSPLAYWDACRQCLLPPTLLPTPWMILSNQLSLRSYMFSRAYSNRFRRRALRLWQSGKRVSEPALSGGGVMLKRSAVDRAGGLFDERFFMYYEDSDLMLRLRHAGFTLCVEPAANAVHEYQHTAGKMVLMSQSESIYFDKHFSGSTLLLAARNLPGTATCPVLSSLTDLGVLNHPPVLDVPASLRQGWLLEISPSPLFVPSIGCFGRGDKAAVPEACWPLLKVGEYFCRLGPPSHYFGRFATWRWNIA